MTDYIDQLKKEVCDANLLLPRYGLVTLTWGNVSAIDRDSGLIVIKPSGVSYETMCSEDMVVTDMEGNIVDGRFRPSSDLKTHLELYKHYREIGGVVHTHSRWATSFAQAECEIPCYGTTHADYFYGPVSCTRELTRQEIEEDYERNTGKVIIETFDSNGTDVSAVPAVVVCKHGPFTWGATAAKAVENALVLEEVAHMAANTRMIMPNVAPAGQYILDKHYFRKHGPNAYYGQK